MREADIPGVFAMSRAALFDPIPPGTEQDAYDHVTARVAHLLATDPGGAWVADRDGEVVGVALALVRERVWGLSLFAVASELQGRGIGRGLLDVALQYGADAAATGWIIMSSASPGAMRRYIDAGFDLHPAVGAAGVPDLRRMPEGAAAAIDAGSDGIDVADALWREVRGAGMGRDIPPALDSGARLLLIGERAAVIARGAQIAALAARDAEAATLALWAALASAPPGAGVAVDCLTGAQQWAIRVCQDARLPLTPDGPLMTRGRLGPLAPYIPSGSYL